MTLPIRAITRFKSLNNLMQELSIMDIESFRQIFGYYTAADVVEQLPADQEKLLASGEEDLFGSADIFSSGRSATVADLEKIIRTEAPPAPQDQLRQRGLQLRLDAPASRVRTWAGRWRRLGSS